MNRKSKTNSQNAALHSVFFSKGQMVLQVLVIYAINYHSHIYIWLQKPMYILALCNFFVITYPRYYLELIIWMKIIFSFC